ncbi:MAG: Nickel transporter UreH [bacterium]|nr:Nickel transporter UreH [bacterium]
MSVASWLLAIALGMRHALEPDHLTAVSTLVARERRPSLGAWLGACWGVGHMTSLLIIGAALAAFRAQMPPRLTALFELAVSLMLIGLGVRALLRALQEGRGCRAQQPAPGEHRCEHGHVHIGRWAFATRSLLIGVVHGLAGSGALVALVAAELPTPSLRIAYLAAFGFGSVLGMALLSGLAGIPLARLGRSPRMRRALLAATGSLSIGLGVAWVLRAA